MAVITEQNDKKTALYREAETKTNRDNIICLTSLAIIFVVCEILNEIGLFQVEPTVMRTGALCGFLLYMTPVVILAKRLALFDKNAGPTYCIRDKYLIMIFTWLGTIAACITLTHHTILAMAVPILLMSQYRGVKQLVPVTIVLATACVFLSVYGGYFIGCFDGNLLHIEITDTNAFDLALRLSLATPYRMFELLTHYVLPREMIILALLFLAEKISQRSNEMLRRQANLQNTVEREMRRTNRIQWQIIDGMANLIENRDSSTGEHVKRTSYYVRIITEQLCDEPKFAGSLDSERAKRIIRAAPLHDIGKIIVSDRILQKPGRLTAEEYEEIKLHAAEGARVIENVLGGVEDEKFLREAQSIAGFHHERWDGGGYPNGLCGEDIPISARIMAVADVFDALVSTRVYKAPIPPQDAFDIIKSEAGAQFDPDVAAAFCSRQADVLHALESGFRSVKANELS